VELLRDPLVGGGSKDFSTPRVGDISFCGSFFSGERDYCMIPLWGGGSKDFYHRLSDGDISFSGSSFSGERDYCMIPWWEVVQRILSPSFRRRYHFLWEFLFRQSGLLRVPLGGRRFKGFSPPRVGDISFSGSSFSGERDYCMIPWWGGGSKDFITVFQTAIFLLVGGSFQASGITA
jgi:hypothetical protein